MEVPGSASFAQPLGYLHIAYCLFQACDFPWLYSNCVSLVCLLGDVSSLGHLTKEMQ